MEKADLEDIAQDRASFYEPRVHGQGNGGVNLIRSTAVKMYAGQKNIWVRYADNLQEELLARPTGCR